MSGREDLVKKAYSYAHEISGFERDLIPFEEFVSVAPEDVWDLACSRILPHEKRQM